MLACGVTDARDAVAAKHDIIAGRDFSIQVRDDRLTLRVAKAPQVYLSGYLGDEAVQRIRVMLQSARIPRGADVYLDSTAGDLPAGLALGRLFRAAALTTHVGLWRKPSRVPTPARPAVCLDACAYAYLGGLYRWAPSGLDRIGVHQALLPAPPGQVESTTLLEYLLAMDVRPTYLAQVLGPAEGSVVWWRAELMAPWQVANNGRQPLLTSYRSALTPELVLSQTVRGGQNRIALRCAPEGVSVTAYYAVGRQRAEQWSAQTMAAYFEIERQTWQPQSGARPHVEGDSLVFTRAMPYAELKRVLRTVSLGAWIEPAGTRVRYGFVIAPAAAWERTRAFQSDCQRMQAGRMADAGSPSAHAR